MRAVLKIVCNVISNRMRNGESFDEIIKDYPKLMQEEIEEIKSKLNIEVV